MPTVEERVSLLEAKMDEQSRRLTELTQTVGHLEARMDRRFDAIDRRFEAVDARFVALEDKMERRFDGVDRALSRMVAIQLASMTAMVAALAGIVTAILQR